MQLAFSTNAYLKFPFAEAVARLAKIGYPGVEIMADVPHAWPACLLEEQKQAIRDALAAHRLAISNINAFMMNALNDRRQKYWHPSWIEPDVNYRRIRVDHTLRALTLAKELGSPCITTEPGGPVEPGASWSAALQLFVEELKPVIEHAEKEGVLLLIEPEPGLLIETAEQFEEFMRHIDSPAVGLNFVIGADDFRSAKDAIEVAKRVYAERLTEEALDAFWNVISEAFPDAKTGGLSPLATHHLDSAAESAVNEWIANNT